LVAELLAARDGRQRCKILSKNGRAASFQDRLRVYGSHCTIVS
jgi:hypothetical protein